MKKKTILFTILALLISSGIFFTTYVKRAEPVTLYHVYLSGKTIGFIDSKKDLEDYIDIKEQEIKDKYNVNKVYMPNDLEIKKEETYNKKVSSVEYIYDRIKATSPFAVSGYTATIKGVEEKGEDKAYITDTVIVNVLDKSVFIDSLKKTISVFVKESDYDNYMNETQEQITDTGSIIENMYIENEITIRESKIPVTKMIFTNVDDLSKYLLFGTLEEQKKYTVKEGDTIEQVAYNNKLSIEEFLIANSEFNSADNLLYPGEVVTLGILKPAFKLIEEDYVVELELSKYKTEIVYDNSLLVGIERIKQEGSNGTNKVSKKIKKSNGEIVSAVVMSSDAVVPTVNRIIVRGKGTISSGNLGRWAWPTKTPYVITSVWGWRWGKFHDGIDISGTGHGSPIYAANDGVVVEARYTSYNGNFIIINHNNGFYTNYGHLSALMVKKGDIVTIGQQIGKMGQTGYAFGTHLHFGAWKGYPYVGGTSFNPMKLY